MKRRIACVLVGFIIPFGFPSSPSTAQSTITIQQIESPITGTVTTLPYYDAQMGGADLTVKDIIETLAQFDVKHADQQPFYQPAYGITDFHGNPPTIWLFNTGSRKERLCTVVHELLHARDVDATEEAVSAEEQRQCKALFAR